MKHVGDKFKVSERAAQSGGLLSRIKNAIAEHTKWINAIEGEDGIGIRKNWRGGVTIYGQGLASVADVEYTSYFKAYDASTTGACRFGVKDGGSPGLSGDRCGIVRINGTEVDVAEYDVEIEAPGNYYAWLFAWMDDVLGRGAEIVINTGDTPAAPIRATPLPTHIVAHGALALGRCTVDGSEGSLAITVGPTQDYLRGGTAEMLLLGPCGNDVVIELT